MNDLPERALAAVEKYGGWEGVLAALKDAERYRWLRGCGEEYEQLPIFNYRGRLDAEFLDRAIDTAMAGANA